MEENILYRFVNEKFTKRVNKVVMSIDPLNDIFADDSDHGVSQFHRVEQQIVDLTVDELKTAMSNNEDVTINREAIVVSENLERGTISLKKYLFSKTLVDTRNHKVTRKYFKVTVKSMTSLTINKYTGDFSLYSRKKTGKKTNVFVRKNVFVNAVKSHLYELQSNTTCPTQINEAIKILTVKLGYHDLDLSNYTETIKYFYNIDPKDQYNRNGLHIFPFLNYLRVNRIDIFSYHALYYFEWIFNKNKSKYRGANIIDYMSDYYGIEDKLFLQNMLYRLIHKNQLISNIKDVDASSIYWLNKEQSRLCYLDYIKLKLFYDLGKNESQHFYYNHLQYIDDILRIGYKTSNDDIFDYKAIHDFLKYYNITLSDYLQNFNDNSESLRNFINHLRIFDLFGVKLKINTFKDYKLKYNFFNQVLQCLFEATNTSGTYVIDKKSIRRIKLYLKDDYKINFLSNAKFKKNSKYYGQETSEYNEHSISIVIGVKDKINTVFIRLNPITKYASTYDPDLCNNTDLNNFTNKFTRNYNGLASAIKIKMLYSKEFFEKLCEQNGVNNVTSFIDYSNMND